MAKLIYSAMTSLDGYIADQDGNFDWAEPDEEVHAFVNDLERTVGAGSSGSSTPRRSDSSKHPRKRISL
jgi:hypothetical protein